METADKTSVPAVIEMAGVTVCSLYDQRLKMLEEVNWKVGAEEYWAVAGMQGSGKSDLLSLVVGLTHPKGGEYRLFGQGMPMEDEDEELKLRLRVGIVFEGGQLLHQLTLRENITLPLRYHREVGWREIDERVDEMLARMELERWAHTTPGNVGRNILKRAGLARALVLRPELLVLDNPLGGLDPRQAYWWLDQLAKLSTGEFPGIDRRMTLVVTMEDLRPWRDQARHFALLKSQRFVPLGQQAELRTHEEPLVKELLAEARPIF